MKYYFTEQASSNNSDLKRIFDELSIFINRFDQLTPQQKDQMTQLIPNGNEIYGIKFFNRAKEIIQSLSKVDANSPESQDFLKNNSDEFAKKVIEFKQILQQYPTNYEKHFKVALEKIESSGIVGTTAGSTPAKYVLSQEEKDKIKQAWDNRNNPLARSIIENEWNKSSDEKKRAAIEYAESQGWDFSEMRLTPPPPIATSPQPQSTNTKTPSNRSEEEVKKDLQAAIDAKDMEKANIYFNELAEVRKRENPQYEPYDLLKKYPNELDAKESKSSYTAPTTTQKQDYAKGYTGVSIVDFLDQSGKPSDFESRKKLAQSLGIQNYTGTASQNTQMLNTLRGGKQYSDGVEVQKAELAKPYTTPKDGKGPTIRYGQMEYPAYIDMGGGKYRLAKQEELDNPNMQLYIPNPKKGQQEYGKPNFVKVRREGSDIRRQSQFGGAIGSASNLFGDIGNTLAKPFRK